MQKIKDFIKMKKVLIVVIIAILVALFFFLKKDNNENISIISPTYGNLVESVRATGQVTSKTDLSLSFGKQGVVKSLKVEVGDKVQTGEIVAMLDVGSDGAEVTRAKGTLALAEAKLKKTLDGSSNEEINLARVALENAKKDYENTKLTQDTLVKNAYNKLLNSTSEALSVETNSNATAPTISGTYNSDKEGVITIKVDSTGNGLVYSLSGIVNGTGYVNTNTPQPISNTGLYVLFSSTSGLSGSSWVVNIPNKKASDYLTNENAYQSALKTQQATVSSALSLVNQKEAELEVKLASARDADVALAEAEVLSAKGGLERAQADYEKNILRAPANGTITKVDIKYGELANAGEPVVVLQDVDNLYVEADINESNIATLKIGQSVNIRFDALGKDKKFTGVISHIDPSAVTSDGVVNYKVKATIGEQNFAIRPGMNTEIEIVVENLANVISIPKVAVIESTDPIEVDYTVTTAMGDGPQFKKYVYVITNEEKKEYKKTEVKTGATGDGNMIQIVSGLSQNDKIALVSKN